MCERSNMCTTDITTKCSFSNHNWKGYEEFIKKLSATLKETVIYLSEVNEKKAEVIEEKKYLNS